MAINIVYVPEYADTGWLDNDGFTMSSWFNRDLTDDAPITLNILEPGFWDDPDTFIPFHDVDGHLFNGTPILPSMLPPDHTPMPPGFVVTAGLYVQLLASLHDDPDKFFVPLAIRALKQSDQMLKNEVRRIR